MTWGDKQHGQKSGHINVFNTDGYVSTENPRYDVPKGGEPYNFFDDVSEYPVALTQLNHPSSMFGALNGFKLYNPEYDKFTNILEVETGETQAIKQRVETQYYNALYEGWHVAPTNNADGHNAMWGIGTDHRTVILAETLSRESVYDAIQNRRVYATEDKTMKVDYTINNEVMGSILDYEPNNLTFKIYASTEMDIGLGKITLVGRTDGDPIKPRPVSLINAGSAKTYTWEFTIDNPDSDFYYVKIDQLSANGYTFTAPIWVKASSVPAGTIPLITGPESMNITEGYSGTSSGVFNISGDPTPT